MTMWLVAGLIAAAVGVLWINGKRPFRHRGIALDGLERLLRVLFDRGRPNGFMVIRGGLRGADPRFLQYALKVDAKRSRYLELAFPVTGWSHDYVRRLEAAFATSDIPWTRANASSEGAVLGLVLARFPGPAEAARAAQLVLVDVLDFRREDRFEVVFEGVSPT